MQRCTRAALKLNSYNSEWPHVTVKVLTVKPKASQGTLNMKLEAKARHVAGSSTCDSGQVLGHEPIRGADGVQ